LGVRLTLVRLQQTEVEQFVTKKKKHINISTGGLEIERKGEVGQKMWNR
jgi:hypothetical protein